ncbi:MAG: hypothetical protein HDT06_04275 [Bacteroidales bacterium]|nr:hypothetical protein [Bacteroidales bacterium]
MVGAWMICVFSFLIKFINKPIALLTSLAVALSIASIIYIIANFPITKKIIFAQTPKRLRLWNLLIAGFDYELIFVWMYFAMDIRNAPHDQTFFHFMLCLPLAPVISLLWSRKYYHMVFDSDFVTARQSKIISYCTVIAAIALTALYAASQPSCEAVGGWTMWILGIACVAYAIWNILLPIRISVKCYLNHLFGMVLWALVVIDWLGSIPLNLDAGKWYVAGMGGLFILSYMLQAKHFSSEPIPAKSE